MLALFRDLDSPDRDMVLSYAEFLCARAKSHPNTPVAAIPEPNLIPRPAQESVLAAIKRLRSSYHMLDSGRLLNETSSLMTQHVMHGRDAAAVIDSLEELFVRHYRLLTQRDVES